MYVACVNFDHRHLEKKRASTLEPIVALESLFFQVASVMLVMLLSRPALVSIDQSLTRLDRLSTNIFCPNVLVCRNVTESHPKTWNMLFHSQICCELLITSKVLVCFLLC